MATATAEPYEHNVHDAAGSIISNSVRWSVAAAVVPVPYLDIAALGAVQVKMVRDLAKAYEVDPNEVTLNGVISSLLGTLGPVGAGNALVGPAVKLMPGYGSLLGSATVGAFGSAATYAIGKIFVRHFEGGGTLGDFSADAVADDLKAEFKSARSQGKSS